MALQPVFKRGYIDYLKNNIKPEAYLKDHFEYDRSQVVRLYGINQPEGLIERLDPSPEGDLQSAIAIYEAYKDITPLFAQQDDLWVYLTHVDLFEYVKKRWPIKTDKDVSLVSQCVFIADHWFRHSKHLFRTSIAGLWWYIKLTIDIERENKYELTTILFKNQEFRTNSFGELPLIRHREAMIGILEFLAENPSLFDNGFNAKARYIRHLFNIIGASKNLSSLSRDFFKAVLNRNFDKIIQAHDVNEVTANAEIFSEIH